MADNETAPTLKLALGQRVDDVQAGAPFSLKIENVRDDSAIVIDQPVALAYSGPHAFTLPPTRFVMISQAAGVITGIDTSPQLRFSNLAETNALAVRMQGQFQAAGWQLVQSYPMELPDLQKLVDDPNRTRRFEKDYAQFRDSNVTLRLYIKEAMGAGLEERKPPVKGNLFLVNVDLADETLRKQMEERVRAKRMQMKGSVTQSVMLSDWLKPAGAPLQ